MTEPDPWPGALLEPAGSSFTARQLPELRADLVRLLEGPASVSLMDGNTFYGDRYVRSALSRMLAEVDPGQVPDELTGVVDDAQPDRYATWLAQRVGSDAALFWVSRSLVALAEVSGDQLPTLIVHREILPSPSGMVYFEGGSESGWAGAVWQATAAAIWVQLLGDVEPIEGEAVEGFQARRQSLGALEPGPCLIYPWNSEFENPAHPSPWTTLISTWLLMGQTITTHEQTRPQRPARRRLARRGFPESLVTTVTLRRVSADAAADTDASGDGETQSYDHRWRVSGHWRNQWYPSAGIHRPIWIDSYVKGPEDAPLLHHEQIYMLRR